MGILVLWAAMANAQTTPNSTNAKQKAITKKEAAKITDHPKPDTAVFATGSFNSMGSYPAKAGSRNSNQYSTLQIADPAIRIFNARANGYDTAASSSGIIGMPKRAYGIANGRLIFRSSAATSSGTITGSGSVGTGSSVGSMGTGAQVQGVNGKSIYAGPGMWGTKVTAPELRPDLPVLQKPKSKNKN